MWITIVILMKQQHCLKLIDHKSTKINNQNAKVGTYK